MIYDYYVDKRRFHKEDSFIDIILDYPIDVTDYEYLRVKLCDFKFLNNIYNISSSLMNNQFNIRRYSKTYTYVYGGSALYFDDTGFYDDQNALLVSQVEYEEPNQVFTTKTLTLGELSLVYRQDYEVTLFGWENILGDTYDVSRKMQLEFDDKWFEIISNDNTRIKSVYMRLYKDSYTGNVVDVTMRIQKYNESTSSYDNIGAQVASFLGNYDEEFVEITINVTSPEPINKYRVICDTGSLPFTLYAVQFQANKQIPVYDAGTIGAPVQHTITIPDGFYKATNLKTTLNDLLSNYKLTASVDNITNKLKIANDNPTFVPTIDDLIDDNYQLDLVIPNIPNMLENWGITSSYEQYINVPFNSYYEGDTNINLINLSKIIITTNLSFDQKTHNELIRGNDMYRGFGNILAWCDLDIAPMTCLNYRNYEDLSYKISNRHVNYIRLSFYSEKSMPLHIDNALIHLQIKKLQKKVI